MEPNCMASSSALAGVLLWQIRQDKMSLLNDDTESNMPAILKTLDTSLDNILLLNYNAAKSLFLISIKLNMSQDDISLLNFEA